MLDLPRVRVDNREVVYAQFMPMHRVCKLNLNPTVKAWLNNR